MWKCKECGTQNMAQARTCEQCGTYAPGKSPAERGGGQPKASVAPQWKCRECGTQNMGQAKTCEHCGANAPGMAPTDRGGALPRSSAATPSAAYAPAARPAVRPVVWILLGALAAPAAIWGLWSLRGQVAAAHYRDDQEERQQIVEQAITLVEQSKLYRKWTKPVRDYAKEKGLTFHQAQDQFAEIGFKSFRLFPHCDASQPDGIAVFPGERVAILGAVVQRAVVAGQDPCTMMGDIRFRVELNSGYVGWGYVPSYRGGEWDWKDMNK